MAKYLGSAFEAQFAGICEKCGCHFITHNDDGSCVSDDSINDQEKDEWAKDRDPVGPGYTCDGECQYCKDKACEKDLLTDALITSCPYCGCYELSHAGEWSAKNEDGEYQTLTEFICEDCARSHWI